MAESAAELNIFNLALSHIGEPLITAGSEKPVVPFMYPFTRDKALTWSKWTFCRTRQALARLSDSPPDTEFTYMYAMPTAPALLMVLDIDSAGFSYQREVYILPSDPNTQTPVILTDASSVVLKYLARTDPSVWPPMFVDTLGLWLALAITQRVSGKTELRAQLFTELQVQMQRLIDIDGHQDTPPRHLNETYIRARGSYDLPPMGDIEEVWP